jgi:hypothetical protein
MLENASVYITTRRAARRQSCMCFYLSEYSNPTRPCSLFSSTITSGERRNGQSMGSVLCRESCCQRPALNTPCAILSMAVAVVVDGPTPNTQHPVLGWYRVFVPNPHPHSALRPHQVCSLFTVHRSLFTTHLLTFHKQSGFDVHNNHGALHM